jgi:DNA-binding protein HU-beta
MNTMSKSDLVAAIAERTGTSRAAAAEAVNAVLDTIQKTVANGDKVVIPGFGVFEAADRSARTAKNPSTGEPIHVPAKRAPRFKAGASFKQLVQTATA